MKSLNAALIRGAAGALCVGAVLAIGSAAYADRAAGDACAAGLTPDGKMIYSATVAQVVGGGRCAHCRHRHHQVAGHVRQDRSWRGARQR